MHGHSAGAVLAAVVAGLLLAAAGSWHLQPWLVWHLTLEPELSRGAHSALLQSHDLHPDLATPAGWGHLEVANFTLRAPLSDARGLAGRGCEAHCVLRLGDGTLAVFERSPVESYGEIVDLLAPDADDISLFRPARRNWNTLESLARRSESGGQPPAAYRFAGAHSHGVVTRLSSAGRHRFLVYAYGSRGQSTRLLGLTGIDKPTLQLVLGSLRILGIAAPMEKSAGGAGPGLHEGAIDVGDDY